MIYTDNVIILILVNTCIFGSMVGSFLNVCIYRLPRSYLSTVTPRSHCHSCGTLIAWYDNIPILSWIMLGGACRHCKSIISVRYTIVEALTTLLFLLLAYKIIITPALSFLFMSEGERWFVFVLYMYLVSVLIITTFIDIDHRIVLDEISISGAVLAPLISTLCPVLHRKVMGIEDPHLSGLIASLFGALIGGGTIYIVGVLGKAILKKEAMGFGDVKFMAMIGGFLGWDSSLLIFFSACIFGSIIGGINMIFTRDRYTPFVPYLAMGTLFIMMAKDSAIYFTFTAIPQFILSIMRPILPSSGAFFF